MSDRPICPDCGCRVPQYDVELRLAEQYLEEWQSVAKQLFEAMGCRRREMRRQAAENNYRRMMKQYTPKGLR